jgi:catechol 2,3-dioxygenase-like lactoylglutathione lyase family enzyme
MQPRISFITLGVDDLERALRFYRDGLGLQTDGIIGKQFVHGAVVFIDLQPGLRLALWPRSSIAHETGLQVGPRSATEMMLAHNVNSPDEVDSIMRQAEAAGARILKPACETFWGGYAGYFQDPDGHIWEAVWNPDWQVSASDESGP